MTRQLEAGRIRRAMALQVEAIDKGFRVTGGSQPRDVLEVDGRLHCSCEDSLFHPDSACKHTLSAVLWKRLGATLFAAVQDAVREAA